MLSILLAIFLPFLAALLIILSSTYQFRHHIGWAVLIVPILLFIYFMRRLFDVADGETFYTTTNWIPTFSIHLSTYLDGLSLLFSLLITGIGALVILYSIYYMTKDRKSTRLNSSHV